jgi:hypothetical protein
MVHSSQLARELPRIARVLTVPLPFRPHGSKRLIYPAKGYDDRFLTYLVEDAPQIDETFPLNKALEVSAWMHREFCFTNEQSRVHAIARLLTPFARALLGGTTRVPLWYSCANRPGAGKDYLSGVPLIVYEGRHLRMRRLGGTRKRLANALCRQRGAVDGSCTFQTARSIFRTNIWLRRLPIGLYVNGASARILARVICRCRMRWNIRCRRRLG